MEWKAEFSVGNDGLDDDHKIIIDLISRFDYAYSVEVEGELIANVLDQLIAYTKYHFQREEEYMHRIAYPFRALKDHEARHQALEEQLDELYEAFHGGKTEIAADISEFLGTWLRGHILETDMKYKAHADKKSAPPT
ncbi:MAG: hemerythrin family protein [Rhodospirillaceae bacterium]|nr:hemerythrin family protein [Rhodospirillaceae bacterium]MBT4118381.1 hemerythrin family protein [Rhodospirillaceae bacterium]MBT4671217.1 hemerythrin family protein [Rhodospirillaceae bacterium]MBT4720913.1 hemerythrin family protein [Rhodospirillaceae bacterium]MBT4748696.1 hemerythrin family protein [Rhodospirillaceae bacterium]